MKKVLMVAVALLFGGVFAAASPKLTLDEAREQITAIVSDPEKLGDVMKQLSAEDQNAFLTDLNKAISNMPGSNESRTAKFLAVNREALLNAKDGNLQSLVATMFATVSLESLPVLSERYGDDLFNRAADATKTFTDEQFMAIAESTVGEVQKKCEGLSDAGPRDTLAIYLFERASNGTPADAEDRLLAGLSDANVRNLAKTEWLPAANGTGSDRFAAMLGYAEAGRAPNVDVTLKIAGPQLMAAMLIDLGNCVKDAQGNRINPLTQGEFPSERGLTAGGAAAHSLVDQALLTVPKTPDPKLTWHPPYTRENAHEKAYQYQD